MADGNNQKDDKKEWSKIIVFPSNMLKILIEFIERFMTKHTKENSSSDKKLFDLDKVDNSTLFCIIRKANPANIHAVPLLTREFSILAEFCSNFFKQRAVVIISTADKITPKFFNKPGTHVFELKVFRVPNENTLIDDITQPRGCMLLPYDIIFKRLVYEESNVPSLELTNGLCKTFQDMEDVELKPSMLEYFERYLNATVQTYERVSFEIKSYRNDVDFFRNLIKEINPLHFLYYGNHCIGLNRIIQPDMRIFIYDCYMGSAQLMDIVLELLKDWFSNQKQITYCYIRFGMGGAWLPPLVVPSHIPVIEIFNTEDFRKYTVKKGDEMLCLIFSQNVVTIFKNK